MKSNNVLKLTTTFSLILALGMMLMFLPGQLNAQGPEAKLGANAAGTAFTYLGRLTDGGSPANGVYDFLFALFDAETNIRFGTYYLGQLIKRFPGNIAAAVGAYNGGPHNMARWLEAHAPVPGDVFVELVSYAQTRNYIRRVLTTWARYTYIETGTWREALGWVPASMTGTQAEGPDY